MLILRLRKARPTLPTSSGIIFIILTAIVPTGFAGSSMKGRLFSILMIWNGKSVKLSHARWSFGSILTVVIRKLFSAVMLRRCSVRSTVLSIWREKLCLSVWFIFECLRLCLRVQPYYNFKRLALVFIAIRPLDAKRLLLLIVSAIF